MKPRQLSVLRRPAMLLGCVRFVDRVLVVSLNVRGLAGRPLAPLGEECYSIYVLHALVAMPIAFIWLRYVPHRLVSAYTLVACLASFVSWLTFRYVEGPMIAAGRRAGEHFRSSFALSTS